jgi:two-component system chemotaxis response regulator CheY
MTAGDLAVRPGTEGQSAAAPPHLARAYGMSIVRTPSSSALHAVAILLLDDDPVFRSMATATLRGAGCQAVVQTSDPRRAMDVVAARQASLLLLDVQRAAFDGLGFLRQLRQRPDGRELPALVFTTSTSGADAYVARALRVRAWVLKPVQPVLLIGHVAATLLPGVRRPEGCQLAPLADAYEARMLVGLQDLAHLANRVFSGHRSFADCGEELLQLLHGLKGQAGVLGYGVVANLCALLHELTRMVMAHPLLAPVSGELVRLIRLAAVAMQGLAGQRLRGDGGAEGAQIMAQLGVPLQALQAQLASVLANAEASHRAAQEAMAVRRAEIGTESWRLRRDVTLHTPPGRP